jgi:FkbM family methyltransferase
MLERRQVNPYAFHIFAFRHGFERLTPRVLHSLASKAIFDFGGFNGDSALAMRAYASQVCTFEIRRENIRAMTQILAANPTDRRNVISLHAGVTNRTRRLCLPSCAGKGPTLKTRGDSCQEMDLVTVDDFVESHNITIGFIKADIEGHALEMVQGALRTLKSQKPIISISCYHNAEDCCYATVALPRTA